MEDQQEHQVLDRLKSFSKNNLLILIFASLGMIFLIVGLIQLFTPRETISFQSSTESDNSTSKPEKILVDVSGSVSKPGVYSLAEDARIKDAIIASGGLAQDADRAYISRNLNLAQKIVDGAKIYIPSKNNPQEQQVLGTTSQDTGIININTASAERLDTLPGIGKVTAGKIIDNRPYMTLEELVTKKAVTKKVFEEIKEKITY